MKSIFFHMMAILVLCSCISLVARAGEHCGSLGGTCKNSCNDRESSEAGAFDDCGEKQECCVAIGQAPGPIKCCIRSFDTKDRGPLNCSAPLNNTCQNGSSSPTPCEALQSCKEK